MRSPPARVRSIWLLAIIAILIMFSVFKAWDAHGSPLDCENIKDSDQRNYCRAISKHQKSYCNFIKNNDLRARCRAEVK